VDTRAFARCTTFSLAALLAGAGTGVVRAEGDDPPEPIQSQFTRVDTPNVTARNAAGFQTDLTELSYRRWSSHGRTDVGAGFGSVALVDRPIGMIGARPGDGMATTTMASGTTLMLGLRYHTTEKSSIYADATHLRGLGLEGEDRIVSKVGFEFKAAQSDWKIAYGDLLGFRLAGDARMSLKVRRSGLAIMMRSSF
jgi:hypothetical protein